MMRQRIAFPHNSFQQQQKVVYMRSFRVGGIPGFRVGVTKATIMTASSSYLSSLGSNTQFVPASLMGNKGFANLLRLQLVGNPATQWLSFLGKGFRV